MEDALQNTWGKPWPRCDKQIAEATMIVFKNISNSHSLNSKHFSITSLVRDHLDEEVRIFFEMYQVVVGTQRFSKHLKKGEIYVIQWLDSLSRTYRQLDDSELVILSNINCFLETLSTLRDFVIVLCSLKSKDGKTFIASDHEDGEVVSRKGAPRAKGKTTFDKQPWYFRGFLGLHAGIYCELCDQHSSFYTAQLNYQIKNKNEFLKSGIKEKSEIRIKGFSKRYCNEHDSYLSHNSYKNANLRRIYFYSLMCIILEGEIFLFGHKQSHDKVIREAAYRVIQSSNLKQLKMAKFVVERFYSAAPESSVDQMTRKSDMIKAYIYYFGSKS